MSNLPPYIIKELIRERLLLIFPDGMLNKVYLTRDLSASTIFTMLYIGAVEGNSVFMGPVHVYRMTDEQAALTDDENRILYRKVGRGFNPQGKRWYADNTRESIRDESLREGFVQVGAVISLTNIDTTSGKPRYSLQKEFAELFDPNKTDEVLNNAIDAWQKKYLSKSALTRLSLAGLGTNTNKDKVLVVFPNKETRYLAAGISSTISKAVIEVFAEKFLESPVVLWLSTSDNKVVQRDDKLAGSIGLNIEAAKNLPDIILVDLGPDNILIVFIEVVATDGAITDRRQNAIYELTDKANFDRSQIVFVTAYMDRDSTGFKKTVRNLAWKSFIWFVSEPDKIIVLKDEIASLSKLINIM